MIRHRMQNVVCAQRHPMATTHDPGGSMLKSNSSFTRLLLALPLVSALMQLDGCATIFTGTTDTLKFDAAGYETQEFQLKREFNYVAILDVTSIPTSGGIDVLTGSLMKFSPNEYHVQMLKKD